MSAHTPGPWWANVCLDGARIERDGPSVAWVGPDYVTKDGKELMTAEAKANARLIAAAPDLLAALEAEEYAQRLANHSESQQQAVVARERADSLRAVALAKAGGK